MDGHLTVPAVVLAGVLSFASPCFLPIVPVFVGYMAGHDGAGAPRRRTAAVRHALAFMAAFTAVFVALWALVGLIGWAAGGYREPARIAGGAVLVLLGLHAAGWVRLPFVDRTVRVGYRPDIALPPTVRRSVLLGLAFGAGWSPCIGPVLGGVLGLATTSATVGEGVLLMLAYSIGLGLPFVLVCAGAGRLTRHLTWIARHHRLVSVTTGVVLMAVGFAMVADLLPRLAGLTTTLL
jgi:cytochrome c-type biogenesis protein